MIDSEYNIDINKSVKNKYWSSNKKFGNIKICPDHLKTKKKT